MYVCSILFLYHVLTAVELSLLRVNRINDYRVKLCRVSVCYNRQITVYKLAAGAQGSIRLGGHQMRSKAERAKLS